MDFHTAQENAHRKTRWLGVAFFCSVLTVALCVGGLSIIVASFTSETPLTSYFPPFISGTIIAACIILFPYLFKASQLAQGGDTVARDLGGRHLYGVPSDFHERRLQNIVEEMALASGVPVPQIYIMDEEQGINAFAAGTEPSNAVIGVTRGCLEHLSREQLQGVIAHEFSHILNGDMRMNMKMVGWVFGLTFITIIGRMLLELFSHSHYYHRRDRESGGLTIALIALGFGLLVIGGIGVFFARLLQSAISRQREYLADASAVQFTRNPDSIAGALMKIGGLSHGSKIHSPKATEASHLFFSDGGLFSFGFATHPPLKVRINRIREDWDGEFPEQEAPPIYTPSHQTSSFAETSQTIATPPRSPSLRQFESLAHDRSQAQLLIFALIAASGQGLNGLEVQRLRQLSDDDSAPTLINQWSQQLAQLSSLEKARLIDLAIPTLRTLSPADQQRFLALCNELTLADQHRTLFEYMLQQVVERHLLRHSAAASFAKVKFKKLSQLSAELDYLSAFMAHCERDDAPLGNPDIERLAATLDRCQHASLPVKQELLLKMQHIANSDGLLSNREAELLRAVADSIGAPLTDALNLPVAKPD